MLTVRTILYPVMQTQKYSVNQHLTVTILSLGKPGEFPMPELQSNFILPGISNMHDFLMGYSNDEF